MTWISLSNTRTSIGKRGLVTSNFPFSLWTWMKSPTTWFNSSKFVTGRWARWNNRDEDFKDSKLKKGLHEKTRTGASFILGWPFDFVTHFTAFILLTGSFYISRVQEDILHVDKIHVRFKSQTFRMRYPFQSTSRPISHRNEKSFRVNMISRNFVPENSLSGIKNRGELTSLWLEPAWHSVVVSCKQIQSHERQMDF